MTHITALVPSLALGGIDGRYALQDSRLQRMEPLRVAMWLCAAAFTKKCWKFVHGGLTWWRPYQWFDTSSQARLRPHGASKAARLKVAVAERGTPATSPKLSMLEAYPNATGETKQLEILRNPYILDMPYL